MNKLLDIINVVWDAVETLFFTFLILVMLVTVVELVKWAI